MGVTTLVVGPGRRSRVNEGVENENGLGVVLDLFKLQTQPFGGSGAVNRMCSV